jgi:hypothetical protein
MLYVEQIQINLQNNTIQKFVTLTKYLKKKLMLVFATIKNMRILEIRVEQTNSDERRCL